MSIERAKNEIKYSPFLRDNYKVTLFFRRSIKGILDYTKQSGSNDISDIFKAVPDFQRDNDKWTQEMQVSFVENIIKGYRTTIMLYEINENIDKYCEYSDCKIMDGLQRLTAIYAFMIGKFRVFGNTYEDLKKANIISFSSIAISIEIYSFVSEAEAVEFYIAINENITHSSDDIQRAKMVLASLTDKTVITEQQ